jgi:hypothetical protein
MEKRWMQSQQQQYGKLLIEHKAAANYSQIYGKDLDSVILHRLKCIVKHRGVQHHTPFDQIFIILGGDTGGRMFRCVSKDGALEHYKKNLSVCDESWAYHL